jgi:Tol biopolymer transport system component
MPEEVIASERLDSWKEIAAYLGRNERTVVRWEKERGLPIHRIPGGQRHGVFAYRRELDLWIAGTGSTSYEEQDLGNGNGSKSAKAVLNGHDHEPLAQPENLNGTPLPVKVPAWRQAAFLIAGFMAALVLVFVIGYLNAKLSFRVPQITEQEQLTSNGQEKKGLLSDGKSLYFGQEQDGRYALVAMPAEGGPIRVLWAPQANVLPVDISPDGKRLLALTSVSVERECEVWIVPLDRAEPRRMGNITAHSSAWAPDGKTIAYASGNRIYLTSEDVSAKREIGSFTALPDDLLWSQDGQRLRFVLEDLPTGKAWLWGQISLDGMGATTLRPLPGSINWRDGWTRGDSPDSEFVSGDSSERGTTPVWLVRYGTRMWEPPIQIAPTSSVPGSVLGIAFLRDSSKLLVLLEPQVRSPFEGFDPHTLRFRQILPGVSGAFLDFSPDSKWVTYIANAEGPLRISRSDGSAVRELTPASEAVELPRWSPDGKQIAYMAKGPGHPWRIFIQNVNGGAAREASEGNDSQGAPTWSPDGRFLAYGGVECDGTQSCAIHRIDIATGKVQNLPNSEGFYTARWSPDGREIAALDLKRHALMLFNVKSGKWRTLTTSMDGPDLSWSADSKYLYANVRGTDARIIRIRVADGHQETVLSVRSLDNFNLAEDEDMQFSVAPDDSLILHRRVHFQEIYAYDLRGR